MDCDFQSLSHLNFNDNVFQSNEPESHESRPGEDKFQCPRGNLKLQLFTKVDLDNLVRDRT